MQLLCRVTLGATETGSSWLGARHCGPGGLPQSEAVLLVLLADCSSAGVGSAGILGEMGAQLCQSRSLEAWPVLGGSKLVLCPNACANAICRVGREG